MLDTFFVIEDDGVEILMVSSHAGGFDASQLLVTGQNVPRHVVVIVHAANDQRLVRISLFEDHHHFVSDARPEERAPAFSRPHLRHAQPAGTVRVVFPLAVPMKLYLHAAIFIDEDLLAGRAGYYRGLETCDHGLPNYLLRAVV